MSFLPPTAICIAAVLLFGCEETDYSLGGSADGGTGPGSGGAASWVPDAGALGPFSIPTIVTELSLPYWTDDDPSLTADMREIYFNSNRPGGVGGSDIWRATRESARDAWGQPEVVAELSTAGTETHASVEPDGLTIWVAMRPEGGTTGYDVWRSRRASRQDAWNPAEFVAELSTDDDDMVTSPGADFSEIYLARKPVGTEAWDMYRFVETDDGFGPAIPLYELNTPGSEFDPFMTADGLSIFFTNQTFGTFGTDIYVAHRTDTEALFGQDFPVVELNSEWGDSDLWISPDLRSAFFSSNRNGGVWNIYEAHR